MDQPNEFNRVTLIVRLSKMNNSINQPDSEALIMITNGSLEVLQLIGRILRAKEKNQPMPNIVAEFDNIIRKVKEGFERYVDAKVSKIQTFIDYFQSLDHDASPDKEELENFLKLWYPFQLKLHNFTLANHLNSSMDDLKQIQKDILTHGNPIFESLQKLEVRIETESKNIIRTASTLDNTIDKELVKILLE